MYDKPIGKLNLIISLMIILGHNTKKGFASLKMKKTMVFIFITGAILIYLILNFLSGLNPNIISLNKENCKTIYHKTGDKNIILRVDDIQAFYNRDTAIKMLDELSDRGLTSVLGVIPKDLNKDKEIVEYLTEHKCDFEIALHGYDNSDYEFDYVRYIEAKEKIEKGLEVLNEIEPNILTFIPPNNRLSEGAEKAVLERDIKIISAGHWNSEYGFTISTFDWTNHSLQNASYVLDNCKASLDNNENCIIMIHPQDYTTNNELDEEKYNEYTKLLDGIKELNASVVNFRDIYYKDRIILN